MNFSLQRLYLSAMHYNENAYHPQRQANGKPSFKLYWPKGRKGTCTVKPLKEHPTFSKLTYKLFIIAHWSNRENIYKNNVINYNIKCRCTMTIIWTCKTPYKQEWQPWSCVPDVPSTNSQSTYMISACIHCKITKLILFLFKLAFFDKTNKVTF